MSNLVLARRAADWHRLKALVLDSVPSPITRRVYNLALDEFITWFSHEPRPGFTKAAVNAWPWKPVGSAPYRSTCGSRLFASWRSKPPTMGCWRRNLPPASLASKALEPKASASGTGYPCGRLRHSSMRQTQPQRRDYVTERCWRF